MGTQSDVNITVVGATGAVGKEVLKVLERRKFPVGEIRVVASYASVGKEVEFCGKKKAIQDFDMDAFKGSKIAILAVDSETARGAVHMTRAAGCIAIDNSSAFRMDDDVPLVIPEINAHDIWSHKGVIANPNCTAAIVLMALWPLHRMFGVKRIIASSYQAVSGAGKAGIDELSEQLAATQTPKPAFFPHQILNNLFPEVDSFLPSGYTTEEIKMQSEGRKIMDHPTFVASVTCVRVPVYRAHSVSVCAEFERPVSVDRARAILKESPGLQVLDDPRKSLYPTPLQATEQDDCFVGRIRKDSAFENGLSFFVCGDQLLKGAALNAVQIAERLIR